MMINLMKKKKKRKKNKEEKNGGEENGGTKGGRTGAVEAGGGEARRESGGARGVREKRGGGEAAAQEKAAPAPAPLPSADAAPARPGGSAPVPSDPHATLSSSPSPSQAPPPGSAPHAGAWSTSLRSARAWSVPAIERNRSTDSPRTEVSCSATACVYERLWYNDGKYYLLVDGDEPVEPWALGKNVHLNVLHVRDAKEFARSVQAKRLRGETLFVDYAYFIHPTAIGHWAEALLPLFSQLRLAAAQAAAWGGEGARGDDLSSAARGREEANGNGVPSAARGGALDAGSSLVAPAPNASAPLPSHGPPDQIVLLNLKRAHLIPWVRELLAVSLGLSPNDDLPPVVWQREAASIWTQIGASLEGVRRGEWLLIDRALVMRDKDLGGPDRARVHGDAVAFRRSVYERYGVHADGAGGGGPSAAVEPLSILFLRKSRDRRVVNEADLLAALAQYGPVTVAEWSEDTPVAEQVALASSASLLVSVHTSALANVILLRPRSIVLELLHRNWLERRLDETFRDLSSGMGDVHHYAWRDLAGPGKGLYLDPRDARRFGNWTGKQCDTEECVEAHTRVDVRVDVRAVRALLDDRLRVIRAGASVAQADLPWPERHLEDILAKKAREGNGKGKWAGGEEQGRGKESR